MAPASSLIRGSVVIAGKAYTIAAPPERHYEQLLCALEEIEDYGPDAVTDRDGLIVVLSTAMRPRHPEMTRQRFTKVVKPNDYAALIHAALAATGRAI